MVKPTPKPHGRRQPLREGTTIPARLRVQAGLSLREVEARTGLSRGIISMIETGRLIPTSEESRRLVDCYVAVESERQRGQTIPG